MTKFRNIAAVVVGGSLILVAPAPANAHQDGCHSWHACPSDTGKYVCGDRGYYSGCPSLPKPTPTTPVLTATASVAGSSVTVVAVSEGAASFVVREAGRRVGRWTSGEMIQFDLPSGRHLLSVKSCDSAGTCTPRGSRARLRVDVQ
ncbi:MAG: hypothetical protein E4H38_08320 [Gemmatimonadales bacterium]|nr:MAG: hypothetical protein E4H38_08320 [Gemmatimonadales bacterium]